jgi:cell wall-associated NlpC family hydrolase
MRQHVFLVTLLAVTLMAACGGPSSRPLVPEKPPTQASRASNEKGVEVALYALGLVDTGYRYGGKNPEAGLDCSGMVSHIYQNTVGLKISGSAADIARQSRPVDRQELRPGDLVFFKTSHRSFSHVGIYIGDARFVHAPSSNGKVRIDRLDDRYYAQRYEAARTLFD